MRNIILLSCGVIRFLIVMYVIYASVVMIFSWGIKMSKHAAIVVDIALEKH